MQRVRARVTAGLFMQRVRVSVMARSFVSQSPYVHSRELFMPRLRVRVTAGSFVL